MATEEAAAPPYVSIVFAYGYDLIARCATVTLEEYTHAALTNDPPSERQPPDTEEEVAGITAAAAALFAQPKSSVTVIVHAYGRDCREVVHGASSLGEHLEDANVVRALAERAEWMLPKEVFARAAACTHEPHHTVIFLAGDDR